ncbi:hypothetical protein ABH307_00620 [Acinetobacter pittii]|uniref:hypothetical protein n=1 Tax=Acinetobacter pittii TaxID=48296 RepID=UPI003261118F
MKALKPLLLSVIGLTGIGVTSVSYADDYGCQALLCFAGGKNVSECQPTINKVLKDLARGKSFPHCQMANENGATNENPIRVEKYVKRKKLRHVDIYIDPNYAADQEHQHQRYYF